MNISETNSTSVATQYGPGVFTVPSIVNLILSVPTNGYVLWLIVNGAGETIASEFFALNLAVSEILFCLFSVINLVNSQIQLTVLSSLGRFSLSFMNTGRPLFQCCICVERYLAVVHPVTFLKYKPLRYRVGCCGAVWLLVFGGGLFTMLLLTTSLYNFSYLVQYLILLSVMLFCCFSVLRALKQPGPGEGDREGRRNTKMRAFKTILIILVSMLVSYISLILIACWFSLLNPVAQAFSNSIGFSISVIMGVVQPLLYLHRAGKLPCIRAL